jgi:LDH2 family malate/lactate/ureidoglycolate dehydrogenase
MMMDVLSGVLTGSGFAAEVHGPYQAERRSRCGHLAMALDIEAFQPLAEFEGRMGRYIAQLKGVPRAAGVDEIFYPGEIEARSDLRLREAGLELPEATLADLESIAREAGIRAGFSAG